MNKRNPDEKFRLPTLKTREGDSTKRWYIEYYAWQRSLHDGKGGLVRKIIYCPARCKTVAERKRWGREIVAKLSKLIHEGFYYVQEPNYDQPKILTEPVFLTLLSGLEMIVNIKEAAYRERTGESYRNVYRRVGDYLVHYGKQELLLVETSARHIYEFSDYIIQVRKLSSRYRNNLIEALRTLFKELIKREYIVKNPADSVESLPVQTSRVNLAFTPQQRQLLEDHLQVNDPAMFVFTRFIYQAFMRPIELTRLQIRDLDLVNNVIVCHSSIAKGGSRKQFTEYVSITPALRAIIDTMTLERYPLDYYLFANNLKPGRSKIIRNRISERHQKALIGAKLYNGELTMYSWKHTGVVNAYKAGVTIDWLQRHLRHSDLHDTVIYLKSLGLMLNPNVVIPKW